MKNVRQAFAQEHGEENAAAAFGDGGGQTSRRYQNDQDAGQSIDDLMLPKSK